MNVIASDLVTLNKSTAAAAEQAVAEIVFGLLPESQRSQLGKQDLFGEAVTKVDLVRSAVRAAQRDGEAFRFGSTAKVLFALPD